MSGRNDRNFEALLNETRLFPPSSEFKALANGIIADRAAVEAAFTMEWSNGPVEGHVHRVKLLKRRGYGRAKFDLLRRLVLAA